MKTAISMPDHVFHRASQRAELMGLSRSEFFARAAVHYLEELDADSLTIQIDYAVDHLEETDDSSAAAVSAGHWVLEASDDTW